MGKLNIAHHKSYHPYRRDNIEKVRRDEEEARLKEAAEEGRLMLADSEARIDLLRHRAGLGFAKTSKQRDVDTNEAAHQPEAGPSSLATTQGHINFFADLEKQSLPITIRTTQKGKTTEETDKGVPLAPSEKDRKPWYSDRNHERNRELDDDRKLRDLARKSSHDPLTSINSQLDARSSTSSHSAPSMNHRYRGAPPPRNRVQDTSSGQSSRPPEVSERMSRESSGPNDSERWR
ncbi:hypothetical protein EIP91_008833 [Steccherinum ochraceum]|uniref:CBF1-interacting co-repressor CIR N-terminal domain-containing protein n=1 Tax=Steccherinum ochraceum TaxID=92696 RepID=A0A4R0R4Y4_9APHY|nr:hypothetical protein EIP91_008833 [Steccherinum ochraceum]